MSEELTSEEIRELLNYITKIKNFEQKYKLHIESAERMIWGCLLVIAAILDFVFAAYLFGYGPVFISWIFIIPVGVLLTSFIGNRQIVLAESKVKKPFYKEPLYIGLLLIIVVMIVFGNANFYFLIMPSIAIIMGAVLLIDHKFVLVGKARIVEYLTPILTITTAVVNVLGYFLIREITVQFLAISQLNFTIFHGLIFGIIFGTMEVLEAYLTRKQLLKL